MKLIDKQLFIEFSEAIEAGFDENYMRKAKSIGTKCWNFINDPDDRRKVLIGFEDLKDNYKEQIIKRYGNPYEYVAKGPIRKLVSKDLKAESFYLTHRFNGDKALSPEHVQKYTIAASWLNMLLEVNANKKRLKSDLKLSLADFYLHVADLIKIENIDLPTNYKRLRQRMDEYKIEGYASLISGKFGNKNTAKICDEVSESVLLELLCHPNQHDDVIIAKAYNSWAAANGYKTIDAQTVGIHRRNNYYQIQGAREGNAAWYNKFGKQIMRNRPTAPMLLINSDDNDLDLYFRDDRSARPNHYFRFKLIVLMDAHNDYILGYSYGETVTVDLIKAAYLDAVYNIKQLTGGWYLPNQIQTDHFAISALTPFYSSIATYTPATARVARAKYIERAFGKTWHQQLKMYPNYAGTNITSKGRINPDNLRAIKNNFPSIDEAPNYIEDFINRLRTLTDDKTGISRQQQWLDAFQQNEKSRQHLIDDMQMLHLFGTQHSRMVSITNGGINVTINGNSFVYDVPDELYLQNVGKQVQITYDPYDQSRVLVTDGASLRFVATEYSKMPSAIADYMPGDRTRLNNLLEQKRAHVKSISDSKANREDLIERMSIDAASLLQASVLTKGIKQNAEMVHQQAQLGGIQYNAIDSM